MLNESDPFDSMHLAAAVNRFDKAPADGSNCGEQRAIFFKESGLPASDDRMFIIFEAVAPNPNPAAGIVGCMPYAQFWKGLQQQTDPAAIAASLEQLYFTGLPVPVGSPNPTGHLPPLMTPQNLGLNGLGQVRMNAFMQ